MIKLGLCFGYMKMNCSQDVYSILTKTNTFLYLKYISGCPRKIPIFREIPDHLHLWHTHTHTRAHTRTHTRTHTHTHTRARAHTHRQRQTHSHAHTRTRSHTAHPMTRTPTLAKEKIPRPLSTQEGFSVETIRGFLIHILYWDWF